jgi:hypothetical protein
MSWTGKFLESVLPLRYHVDPTSAGQCNYVYSGVASWDMTQLRFDQGTMYDLKANLPTITARKFAETVSAACTTCGTYYIKTHNLTRCTDSVAGQTLQLS